MRAEDTDRQAIVLESVTSKPPSEEGPETDRAVEVGKSGSCQFSVPMHSNDVVLLTLERTK